MTLPRPSKVVTFFAGFGLAVATFYARSEWWIAAAASVVAVVGALWAAKQLEDEGQ